MEAERQHQPSIFFLSNQKTIVENPKERERKKEIILFHSSLSTKSNQTNQTEGHMTYKNLLFRNINFFFLLFFPRSPLPPLTLFRTKQKERI